MGMTPFGVSVTVAAAVVLAACGSGDEDVGVRGDARIVMREVQRERADGAVYAEGFLQFVEPTAAGGHEPALKVQIGRAPRVRTVEHGEYRVSSYTRTCEAACSGALDPPTGRCSKHLSIARGDRQALRIVTVPGRRCRIRLDR